MQSQPHSSAESWEVNWPRNPQPNWEKEHYWLLRDTRQYYSPPHNINAPLISITMFVLPGFEHHREEIM